MLCSTTICPEASSPKKHTVPVLSIYAANREKYKPLKHAQEAGEVSYKPGRAPLQGLCPAYGLLDEHAFCSTSTLLQNGLLCQRCRRYIWWCRARNIPILLFN